MLAEAQLAISSLKILLDIYLFRKGVAKAKKPSSGHDPMKTDEPDTDHLEELIEEIGKGEQEGQDLSEAIDLKFPPAQAKQIKDDYSALSLITTPPDISHYDYFGIISQYVKSFSSLALKTEVFRLRGWKANDGMRCLLLQETAAAILSFAETKEAVYSYAGTPFAEVTDGKAVLTDESTEIPLVLVVQGKFQRATYGIGGHAQSEKVNAAYRPHEGQDRNWIEFRGIDKVAGFCDFTHMLKAVEVRRLIDALKKDIFTYLSEVEDEQPIVKDLGTELKQLFGMIAPKS